MRRLVINYIFLIFSLIIINTKFLKVMTNLELITPLIVRHTKNSTGITLEELSGALTISKDSLRGLISSLRKEGVPIIDRVIEGATGRPQKEYFIARSSEEYYKWRVSQLGEIEVKKGAPTFLSSSRNLLRNK